MKAVLVTPTFHLPPDRPIKRTSCEGSQTLLTPVETSAKAALPVQFMSLLRTKCVIGDMT